MVAKILFILLISHINFLTKNYSQCAAPLTSAARGDSPVGPPYHYATGAVRLESMQWVFKAPHCVVRSIDRPNNRLIYIAFLCSCVFICIK